MSGNDRRERGRRRGHSHDPLLERRPGPREIDEELDHHLQGRIDDLIAAGYSRSAAEREARKRFGDVARVRQETEQVYRQRRPWALEALWADLSGAFRSLRRRPAFTVTAILLLAIGIGTSTAMLALVDGYMLRDMPFPFADRLLRLQRTVPPNWRGPGPDAVDWSETPAVELAVSWDLDAFTLVGDGRPEQVPGAWVAPDFFPAFGVQPVLGRGFTRDEAVTGAPVAIIGHSLWQNRYGADPDIIGRTVRLYASDRPDEAAELTVVGVLPADFWHFNRYTQILAPLAGPRSAYVVRLAPGVRRDEALASMSATAQESWGPEYADWGLELVDMHEAHVQSVGPILAVLGAAVALVLLIACANVAMLLVVQAAARTREFAVRAALGAGGRRLAVHQLLEAALLGVAGAAVGLFTAARGLAAFAPAVEQQLGTSVPGGTLHLAVGPRVAAMSVGVTLLVTLLFGLAPTAAGLGRDLSRTLTGSGRGATGSRKQRTVRTGLIIVELALSLALLVGAGLTLRSAVHLGGLHPGFEGDGVLQVQMGLSSQRYPTAERWDQRITETLASARSTAGVASAAASLPAPFVAVNPARVEPLDGPVADAGEDVEAAVRAVSPEYFRTLEIPLLRGRDFDAGDRMGAEAVAIVSEDLAARLWPGQNPLGRSIRAPDPMGDPEQETWHRVVGVVGETREGISGEGEYPDAYLALSQAPRRYVYLHVRSSQSPELLVPVLEEAVWARDAEQPLTRPVMMTELLDAAGSTPRALARLLAGFALFGVVLAVVGVYGVIAFAARQRRRELAVRVALGAADSDVRRLVLRHGATVVGTGLGLGLLAAWGMARALSSQVYGVSALDPLTFLGVTILLGSVAFAGVLLPARRAATADPMMLLREE